MNMKYSIYNNIISIIQNRTLLYNAYTNSYMILSSPLYDIFNTEVDNIQKKHEAFFNQLKSTGCLVEDTIDEIALLKQRIKDVDENPKGYRLTINPTIDCNFKCWYCYENHQKTMMSNTVLSNVLKLITKIISAPELVEFELSFFGGEPLLYYKPIVLPILEHLTSLRSLYPDKRYEINFTTNGYLLTDAIMESMKAHHVSAFQITLDGDREEHDKTRFPYKGGKSFDKIVANIIKLVEKDFL